VIPSSAQLQAKFFDDRCPGRRLLLDFLAGAGQVIAHRHEGDRSHPLHHFLVLQHVVQRGVQLLHDLGRRFRRRGQHVSHPAVDALHAEILHHRDVGHQGATLAAGDQYRPHDPAIHLALDAADGHGCGIDVAAQDVVHGWRRALVGDVGHREVVQLA